MSNSANLKKHHHQSAYKLNNQSHNSNSVYNRINHSTSFVIAEGTQDSSLDTCPKCGRNVCEHTSVADVINLPNSISQDFSTYSSDSSLIKQLMNESTSSTGTVRSSTNRCIDYETMSPLPGIPMEPNTTNLMFSQIFAHFSKQQKQHQPPTAAMSNYITFNVLRPVSCQYVLDTETTDRLLKDFFESTPNSSENATREKLLGLVTNTKPKLTSNKSEKTTQTIETNQDVMMLGSAKSATNKKPKFSNLRLLLNGKNSSISSTVSSSSSSSSSATNTAKSPFKSQILRSTTNPFVNCLTSSSTSSSSSYEEINSNSNAAIIMQENHSSSTCESKENTIRKQEAPSTSSASSNHLFMTSESVNNSNSEQQYLFKHDTTASDIERKLPNTLKMNNTNRSVVSLNSKITSDLYDETDYNELHGLELCPIVGREIDDEDIDIRTNHQKQPKTNIENVNESLISVRLNNSLTYEYKKKDESSTKINSTTSVINEEETPNKSPSAKKIDISMPLVCRLKNRLSYFSSCSSCDFHSSRESCLDMSDSLGSSVQGIRYHSISVIFIIMALFSLNLVQESYFLFHYFISEQFYWFTYAVVSIFTGQVLTLILSLVSEIDLARITQRAVKSSSSSSSASSSTATKENLMNLSSEKNRSLKISKNYDLYRVFSNPFSKLALIMPGFLPICVYSQFLRTLFEYRKSSARNRFRHEFKLSIYLFLTALFFSMPIAVLNSCYLASITKWSNSLNKTDPSTSQPVQWYYTELFSVFTTSTLFNKTSESSSSHVSESSSAESFSRVVNHRKNAAATLSSETTLMQINAKNQFLLVLISIFFSVSIGICVFVTYYELLKQNYEHVSNKTKSVEGFGKVRRSRNRNLSSNEKPFIPLNESSQEVVERSPDLGLIEILVYFCYRFCLIISRLAALALVCYLFQQWMFVFLAGHVLLVYLSSFMCLSSSATKSCLHQQISHFIVCLLSFVDLFSSQIAELANFRKVIAYYALYFVQNVSVCTYWLVRTVYEAQLNRNHKPADSNSNSASLFISSTTTCYATLVYLCIILFTIFGLILKFLHLHILRKRYRQNL